MTTWLTSAGSHEVKKIYVQMECKRCERQYTMNLMPEDFFVEKFTNGITIRMDSVCPYCGDHTDFKLIEQK
jgi:hypothetical protein